MGETCYKLDNCIQALDYFDISEKTIAPKQDINIILSKAKCHDKMKKFKESIKVYGAALALYGSQSMKDLELEGNIYFRLGWANIRSKQNVEEGIKQLKKANELQP